MRGVMFMNKKGFWKILMVSLVNIMVIRVIHMSAQKPFLTIRNNYLILIRKNRSVWSSN